MSDPLFYAEFKTTRSRILSRDRHYLRCFQSVCVYKSFSISAKIWKLSTLTRKTRARNLFQFKQKTE